MLGCYLWDLSSNARSSGKTQFTISCRSSLAQESDGMWLLPDLLDFPSPG